MDELSEKQRIQERIAAWERAGPVMQASRDEAIRKTDTPSAIAALNDAYECAVRDMSPRKTSGLIEQQAWFARLRDR